MLTSIKIFLIVVKNDLIDSYKRVKIILFAIAALIIALEFGKIKDALLVSGAKKEIQKDEKIDQDLAAKEKSENDQANALVQQAAQEPSKEKPINDDWNK